MQNRAVARVVEGRQPLPGLCDIVGMRIEGKKASICQSSSLGRKIPKMEHLWSFEGLGVKGEGGSKPLPPCAFFAILSWHQERMKKRFFVNVYFIRRKGALIYYKRYSF